MVTEADREAAEVLRAEIQRLREERELLLAASSEARSLIDDVVAVTEKRQAYGIDQELHDKLCAVRATLATRADLSTPSEVASPNPDEVAGTYSAFQVSEPVADHIGGEGESGISWNGYYLRGDNKSVDFIAATLRKVEYLEQCVDQLRARLATPPVREAVTTIIARCEALEDEASDRLAVEDCGDIERGYFNGQKATAKSLRLHLHDMTRAALPTPSEVGEPVAAESGGEGEREYEAFRAECHCAGDFPPATHVLTMHGFHLALVRYLAGRTTPPNTNGDAVREALEEAREMIETLRTSGHWPGKVMPASDAVRVSGKLRHAIATLAKHGGAEG